MTTRGHHRHHYGTIWRPAPIQLVVTFVGGVVVLSVTGIVIISIVELAHTGCNVVKVPEQLGTIALAALTGLAGLLAPNTGLTTTGRSARHAEHAGAAAAAAVLEHEQLVELSQEADRMNGGTEHDQ